MDCNFKFAVLRLRSWKTHSCVAGLARPARTYFNKGGDGHNGPIQAPFNVDKFQFVPLSAHIIGVS